MSAPTKLLITLVNSGGTITIPIAPSLVGLDSGQTVETQTGFFRDGYYDSEHRARRRILERQQNNFLSLG